MNRETVIQLAREAGFWLSENIQFFTCTENELERFAAAIEQRTLERAAQVAESYDKPNAVFSVPRYIAAAIRALKETT